MLSVDFYDDYHFLEEKIIYALILAYYGQKLIVLKTRS